MCAKHGYQRCSRLLTRIVKKKRRTMPLQSHLKAQRVRKITTLIRLLLGDALRLRLLTKAVKVRPSLIDRVEVPRLQLNKP